MNKLIGSTMIIVGTSIGAGMLALPMVSTKEGFFLALLLAIAIWALMTFTGFLLLEVSLSFPLFKNNFATMAKSTLGKTGSIFTSISYLILLYAVTSAYISGNTSLLAMLLQNYCHIVMPNWINASLFTLALGGIIFYSTSAVDYLNRFLLGAKCILLFATLFMLSPYVKFSFLINAHHEFRYVAISAPIFVCSFCYHIVLPSIINYNGKNLKTLKKAIFSGTIITLCIYVFWLCVTMGIIPLNGINSFATISASNNDVGTFIGIISKIINKPLINMGIDAFANIAMTTSFLGVGLSLFDFLADSCKRKNNVTGRLQTALIAFIPPLIFAIFYPQGFILALGYASIFIIILCIILPALMTYKHRRAICLKLLNIANFQPISKQTANLDDLNLDDNSYNSYKVTANNLLLFTVFFAGIVLIFLQIFVVF